jgi:hypothetical protein
MIRKRTTLLFAPTGQYVEAHIMELTPALAERRIHQDWWNDPSLRDQLHPPPIDLRWNWNAMKIEYGDSTLAAENVAIVTGDRAVQGAMMVSTEPISSRLVPGAGALLVELLFTAPRNRPALRRDGKPFFLGVGTELLSWAAWLSRKESHSGRLALDASPDYVGWYEKRGLQKLKTKHILFEGVAYTPMELTVHAADQLLSHWGMRDRL